jgi:hypothetical protein
MEIFTADFLKPRIRIHSIYPLQRHVMSGFVRIKPLKVVGRLVRPIQVVRKLSPSASLHAMPPFSLKRN